MDNDLIISLLEEEISRLRYLAERHRKFGLEGSDPAVARQHRIIADTLEDAAKQNQDIIDSLKNS